MKVCKEYEARISALIDDELTDEERVGVLEHLSGCPACRAYHDDLLALRGVLRAQEQTAPTGFAQSVMARVHETAQETTPERKVLAFPQWKRLAAIAACLALVLAGMWTTDLLPGMDSGMDSGIMNMEVTNGCAAPEVFQTQDADGGLTGSASRNSQTDSACEVPEAPAADEKAEDNCYAYGASFCAAIETESAVAQQWVEEQLGAAWESGASYVLSKEQYDALRSLLTNAGEEFTEIMGEGSKCCLLAK